MAGRNDFNSLRKLLTEEQETRSNEQYRKHRIEMILAELREKSGMSPTEQLEAIGDNESGIAKFESLAGAEIAALSKIVEALGGHLEVNAIMPEGIVHLTQFASQPSS